MTPGSIKIVLQDGTRAIKEMNTFVIASCHQVLESPLIHAHAQTLIIIFLQCLQAENSLFMATKIVKFYISVLILILNE